MRVPQRLDYVLRALTWLAQQPHGHAAVIGDMASRLGLPKRFLEQQMTLMAKAGLVSCRRGSGGGCSLARPAEEISVADVVLAVQGEVVDVPHVRGSAVSAMWSTAAGTLRDALADVHLSQLAEQQTALDASAEPMYYI